MPVNTFCSKSEQDVRRQLSAVRRKNLLNAMIGGLNSPICSIRLICWEIRWESISPDIHDLNKEI